MNSNKFSAFVARVEGKETRSMARTFFRVEHDMHGLTGLIAVTEVSIHSDTNDLRHAKPISRLLI